MRYFELLGVQHVAMFLLPTLIFIVLFALGLGFYHFRSRDAAQRESEIVEEFPDGIQGRNAPFPVITYVTIAGTVIWVFGYILAIGLWGVTI